jgi:putative transposase
MLKAYKYRIYPNGEQKQVLEHHFGCVRYVYNWGLALKKERYETDKKSIGNIALTNKMKAELKTTHPWLNDVNSQCLQMALRNLDTAYKNFFRTKKGFPKFKSKKENWCSFQCPQFTTVNFTDATISILKVKSIPITLHRPFKGAIKTTTISKTASGWYYASLLVDTKAEPVEKKTIQASTTIGIDTGIKSFLVSVDGRDFANNGYLKKSLQRLKILQRRYQRKKHNSVVLECGKTIKKNSNNREKCRIKVARLHEKISNQRLDYIQKITHALTHDSQVKTICVEDLNIRGMIKNHKLARSLSDVSIGKFYEILGYKCEWYGINLIKIGRFEASSKTCSGCGSLNDGLKLSHREWVCKTCHAKHDRDVNAAINIKNFGLRKALGMEYTEVKSVECPLVDDRSVMNLKSNGTVKQKKRRGISPKAERSLAER